MIGSISWLVSWLPPIPERNERLERKHFSTQGKEDVFPTANKRKNLTQIELLSL